MARQSTLNTLEIPVKLCPGFLKDIHPQLSVATAGKHRAAILAWEVIVDDHGRANSVNVEVDKVAASCIDCLCVEQLFDVPRIFSN